MFRFDTATGTFMDELDAARKLLLDAHKEWVESMGERGKRLDLSGENLSGANFAGADFSGADLSGQARFLIANLCDADFAGARFAGAKLGAADLTGVDVNGSGKTDRRNPHGPRRYPDGFRKTLDPSNRKRWMKEI